MSAARKATGAKPRTQRDRIRHGYRADDGRMLIEPDVIAEVTSTLQAARTALHDTLTHLDWQLAELAQPSDVAGRMLAEARARGWRRSGRERRNAPRGASAATGCSRH